jgi:RNA polymerase sigma factor (sigma-70 family)
LVAVVPSESGLNFEELVSRIRQLEIGCPATAASGLIFSSRESARGFGVDRIREPDAAGWDGRRTEGAWTVLASALGKIGGNKNILLEVSAMKTKRNEGAVLWRALESKVEQALDQLATGDREFILLRFYRRLTYAEIGRRLAITEEAAAKCVSQALEKLRKILAALGVQAGTMALGKALLSYAAPPVPAAVAAKLLRVTAIARQTEIAPTR